MARKRDPITGRWLRRISRKTVSRMYSLAHYRFRQFMKHKAKQHGANLFIVSEAYTTKTCGLCGVMHEMGGSKIFKCPACGSVFDRDANAARNILLKFINDNGKDRRKRCPVDGQQQSLL
jgi:putative transposase